MTILQGTWRFPTEVLAGPGRIGELAARARDLGARRALLVSDAQVAKLPFFAPLEAGFAAAGIATARFTGTHPDPLASDVAAGVAAFRAHEADLVVAIGGGSALDCGKTIALAAATDRPLWDFEITLAAPALDRPMVPILAVPTTAGTGSEVGRASVITDEQSARKVILLHPQMLPRLVVLDAELTIGLPATLTAWTGMDALAHNLEAYCIDAWHPMADGVAVEGMRLIHGSLVTATTDGRNLAARGTMLAAASMGATAFQKGLGAIHSLSHPIGAQCHAHHGLTNAVLMPYVLEFNRHAIEPKIVQLARSLGIEGGFEGVRDWVIDLRKTLGIPHTVDALGVTAPMLDALSEQAFRDPNTPDNPRPADAAALRRILAAALEGRLDGLSR
ncbi:iron-containing alcohol dehydrogenase [Acidiphilium sp. C61]|jgi:alcohol dehydrogenase class IV|uniref:iron-containing alcohol dehydrogenase n=1 Tax=Acidiphilium sp. C61 TaxID=1671485 RepID=UPI00157AE857|nr:iron-containing alcohol dehydrogenase [Acidiphilium sp. C61]